tara:strand:- start:426 stop:1157 length:732 start_codon:yes stop_codon:yes gene_type:complete
MKFKRKYIYNNVKKSWKNIITKSMTDEQYKTIKKTINSSNNVIYPNIENVFETFKYFDVNELKVVILGQDCYINCLKENDIIYPQANGLAFSVSKKHKIPPSLKNIFKELDETMEDFKIPDHGDLTRWVSNEKILLLNSALTVEHGKSNSHIKLWEPITDNIIKLISDNCENIVFILWGNFAKSKKKFIDSKKHYIIDGVHPSPLACKYNLKGTSKSFFGHSYFKNTNNFLKSKNILEINWNL